MLNITVCYPLPTKQKIFEVSLPEGATVQDAIDASQVLAHYPEIDLSSQSVGIYSRKTTLESVLHDRDRVEIYRPCIDPKTARFQRLA